MIAAMILGALAASKNPQARRRPLITGGQALAIAAAAQFLARHGARGRPHRLRRDDAGGLRSRRASSAMFEKLQQASRLNDNGSYPYLRTPPDDHRAHRRHAGAPAARRRARRRVPDARARDDGRPRARALQPGRRRRCAAMVAEPTPAALARSRARGRRACCTPARWRRAKLRDSDGARALLRAARKRVAGDAAGSAQAAPARRRDRARQRRLAARAAAGRLAAARRRPEVLLRAQAQIADRPAARGGAAPADLGGARIRATPRPGSCCPPRTRRRASRAGDPRRGRGAGRAARLPGGAGPLQAAQDLVAQGRRGATTSRRRSSTPARARWNHFFANRRSSADSITMPSTE